MASSINALTAAGGGIAMGADASGILQLQSAGTATVTVDASGNVGIANTTPSSYNGVADNLVIGTSGSNGLTIVAGTASDGSIHFADGTSGADAYRGQIYYSHAGNYMVFGTDAVERMSINSVGNVTLQKNISVGGAAPTTSGSGITFPATQRASSDANTLDDYEEGTFTPTLIDGSNNQPTTYSQQVGTYTKVGNLVTVQIYLEITTLGGTITGNVFIGGLPFTSSAIANNYQGVHCGYWATMTTALNFVSGYINPSTVRFTIVRTTAAATSTANMTASNWANSANIMFSCSYRV
jgi:hypothetical protein